MGIWPPFILLTHLASIPQNNCLASNHPSSFSVFLKDELYYRNGRKKRTNHTRLRYGQCAFFMGSARIFSSRTDDRLVLVGRTCGSPPSGLCGLATLFPFRNTHPFGLVYEHTLRHPHSSVHPLRPYGKRPHHRKSRIKRVGKNVSVEPA